MDLIMNALRCGVVREGGGDIDEEASQQMIMMIMSISIRRLSDSHHQNL